MPLRSGLLSPGPPCAASTWDLSAVGLGLAAARDGGWSGSRSRCCCSCTSERARLCSVGRAVDRTRRHRQLTVRARSARVVRSSAGRGDVPRLVRGSLPSSALRRLPPSRCAATVRLTGITGKRHGGDRDDLRALRLPGPQRGTGAGRLRLCRTRAGRAQDAEFRACSRRTRGHPVRGRRVQWPLPHPHRGHTSRRPIQRPHVLDQGHLPARSPRW